MLTYLYVHPMIELTLLASLLSEHNASHWEMSCADINTLVDRAKVYPDISEEHRQEAIDLYCDFGETYGLNCRDAKAD